MKYMVKCDECKQTVKWTDNEAESYEGIMACDECRG